MGCPSGLLENFFKKMLKKQEGREIKKGGIACFVHGACIQGEVFRVDISKRLRYRESARYHHPSEATYLLVIFMWIMCDRDPERPVQRDLRDSGVEMSVYEAV